jgi:carbon storage regulator
VLILTRRPEESIVLDGGIRITILQADSGSVRIGIEAPPEVGIFREELLERIAKENQRARIDPGEAFKYLATLSSGRGPASHPKKDS